MMRTTLFPERARGSLWGRGCLLGILLVAAPITAAEDGLVYSPLAFGGVHEFGAVYDGLYSPKTGPEVSPMEWVDHFGVFLRQDVTIDRRLELQLGLGGVFQFPKPEHVFPKYFSSMYKLFFFGPTVAKATYNFGDPDRTDGLRLGGGLFPFKYNPDAVNLGEYLLRSGPYPTYLQTGGALFVHDNAAYLQGLHANYRVGDLSLNALFFTETMMPPLYDWSLALLANYSIADGLVELGTGINFKRLVQIDPDRTVRKVDGSGDPLWSNIHFTRGGVDYYADPVFYEAQADFYNLKGTATDSTKAAGLQAVADSVTAWRNPSHPGYVTAAERNYYTPAGIIMMGRASFDVNKLLGMEAAHGAFKVFAEAAILGLENHPVFFEDRMRRAPVMLGAHIPTFGLLDQLTVQFEYFDSPWANSTRSLGENNIAVPSYPSGFEPLFSREEYNDITDNDNLAWSVLAHRELFPGLHLSVQFARDHLRTVGTNWYYGGRLEPSETLYRNGSWYWMTQLSWGL